MAMAALMMVSAVTGCTSKAVSSDGTFTPKETINWTVTSSPGGGSDIYTRMISDIMTKENLVNGQPIIVTNKTDGSGEIGRNEVATTKGSKADYTLLTFNSGDLMPMVQNTKNRSSNFRILAIMAVDKQFGRFPGPVPPSGRFHGLSRLSGRYLTVPAFPVSPWRASHLRSPVTGP